MHKITRQELNTSIIQELDRIGSGNVIESETEPTTGLYNGLIWYKVSIDDTKI